MENQGEMCAKSNGLQDLLASLEDNTLLQNDDTQSPITNVEQALRIFLNKNELSNKNEKIASQFPLTELRPTGSHSIIEFTEDNGTIKTIRSENMIRNNEAGEDDTQSTSTGVEPAQASERPRLLESAYENVLDADVADKTVVQNSICDMLQKTARGLAIIEYHRLFGLDNPTRVLLAECVIENEYGADVSTVVSCARFIELAALIVEAFPGELAATYYIPSSTRGKGKSPSGKLYDQYANLNKILRKVKLRAIRPRQRDTVSELSGRNGDISPLPPKSKAGMNSLVL